MSTGILFVTAMGADNKVVNDILQELYDDEFGSGDRFSLVTKEQSDLLLQNNIKETSAGSFTTSDPFRTEDNEWSGVDFKQIEEFVLRTQSTNKNKEPSLFLVLDQQGLEQKTIIVGNQVYDYDENKMVDKFLKLRIPWQNAYGMWCNLDIGNMGFEDFAEDEGDEDGWCEANDFANREER